MILTMILSRYKIILEGENKYVFFTKKGVEYQIITMNSGIIYRSYDGAEKEVLELVLNCDINIATRDYQTINTLVYFCKMISHEHDAIFMQIHNQPEYINNNKVVRRGLLRLKLWNRIIAQHFRDQIMLNNLVLGANKENDILTFVVKRDSVDYEQCVINFYRFCHSKMYK